MRKPCAGGAFSTSFSGEPSYLQCLIVEAEDLDVQMLAGRLA